MSEQNPIRTTRTLIQDLPADSNELFELSQTELEDIAGGEVVATLAISSVLAFAPSGTCTDNKDSD